MAGTAVAPASPRESATAVYRGWQGRAPKGASFRIATTGPSRIAVQLPGLGGTWRDCADAAIQPGFNGELRLEVAVRSGDFEAVRIVLKGPVTLSALQLDE
jgi:hypothetical protein